MDIDIDRLRQELNEIDGERQKVNERLREYSARGRGRGGPGGFPQRPLRGPGGPPPYSHGPPPADGDPSRPGPNRHERIPSYNERPGHAPPAGGEAGAHRSGSGLSEGRSSRDNGWASDRRGELPGAPPARPRLDWRSRYGEGREPDQARMRGEADVPGLPPPPAVAAPPERKRVLSSAVVVADGAQLTGPEEAPGIAKRPREDVDDNPAAKKRNRRMFGALLGTLQKFKEEDAAERSSRLAQQRVEALKRADARAAEEVLRARDFERQQLAAQRMAELNRKRELNAAAEVKRAEIALAKRYTHQAALARFLRTAAQPRLLWQPARHCADTILLQEQAQLDLAIWLEGEKAKLEEEKTKVVDRTKAIIAQAQRARNGPAPGAVTPRSQAAGGANNNRAAEEGGHEDGEGDEEMGDGADEAAAEEEQHNGGAHAAGGGGRGGLQQEAAAAGDRFIADPEGSPQREAREAADGDGADDAGGAAAPEAEDDMEAVAYAADGAAETVEDLLK